MLFGNNSVDLIELVLQQRVVCPRSLCILHWRHCFCFVRCGFCPVFRSIPNRFLLFCKNTEWI